MKFDNLENIWDTAIPFELPTENEYGYIYALFFGEEIIYIGQTVDVRSRINSHPYLSKADSCKYFRVPKDEMTELEAQLILKYLPKYNKSLPNTNRLLTIDDANKIHQKAYSNRIGLLRILREMNISCHNGYYHYKDLKNACDRLVGDE